MCALRRVVMDSISDSMLVMMVTLPQVMDVTIYVELRLGGDVLVVIM